MPRLLERTQSVQMYASCRPAGAPGIPGLGHVLIGLPGRSGPGGGGDGGGGGGGGGGASRVPPLEMLGRANSRRRLQPAPAIWRCAATTITAAAAPPPPPPPLLQPH